MRRDFTWSHRLAITGAAFAFAAISFGTIDAYAAGARQNLTIRAADPTKRADGTLSSAARRAMTYGALPRSKAEMVAKAAATAAAQRTQPAGPLTAEQLAPTGKSTTGPLAPAIVRNFEGIFHADSAPSDSTGAVGPTRYIELINRRFAIYDKTSNTPLDTGTLNKLAGVPRATNSFDPQIIWDPTSKKFYYTMDSVFSATDNELAFGFSKTASPNSEADFCQYLIAYGSDFPDYPKLGDSRHFLIIGVNTFDIAEDFIGADLIAVSKPGKANITTCPDGATFKFGFKLDVRTPNGQRVFTPVAANEIDTLADGYVVARNNSLPSNRLWLFKVTRNANNGNPQFRKARGLAVPNYTFPPNAPAGAGTARLLDTLDARNTQAVLAINPRRGENSVSLWTQHTIASGTRSIIKFYEINPVPNPPVLRSLPVSTIGSNTPNVFFFNAAISPDRRVDGKTKQFGNSFGIGYSVTKAGASGINPRIVVATSVNGAAFVSSSFKTVQNSAGPYNGFDCEGSPTTCRWGDYSAATPDPRPSTTGAGKVWFTNMYASGVQNTSQSNWRTRNWAVTP